MLFAILGVIDSMFCLGIPLTSPFSSFYTHSFKLQQPPVFLFSKSIHYLEFLSSNAHQNHRQ